ncbi:MAG TPA: cbb3-type cytochrome c oxidase N-terminal domain-containing protein [Pelobium sp.]|nr:cbb3-type cytochrome c oxidase N-terminal domain-containing protein [Pelobium sp.]
MRLRNKIFLTVTLITIGADSTFALSSAEIMNAVALGAIISTLLLIVIACFVLLKTFRVLTALALGPEQKALKTEINTVTALHEAKVHQQTIWQKLLSLRPLSEEKELLIMHDYDNIQELDNPIPAWFNWLFYGSVVFAFVYILNYHVFNLGKLQDEEYAIEMKQAEVAKEAYLAKSGNAVDENSVKLDKSVAVLDAGKAVFAQNCVACHGQNAEGIVGPNLTDEYWLHGGSVKDVFKVIKYGVPEKGMIAWEKQLSPKQISDVANYIESLKGTNPANPKAPQGEKE